jgi:hypothetical protein
MGKNWGWWRGHLGMKRRKMGRTSGFRETPLTSCDVKRNLSPVRRQEPTEPQASTARWERGKPEGKPQGGTEGSRENAARRDRGMGASPARGGVTGVGRKIRPEVFRGVSRRLPWSRRDRCGWRLSDTISASAQRFTVDVAPRSTGGFGRTVTRGCVASGDRCGGRLPLAPLCACAPASSPWKGNGPGRLVTRPCEQSGPEQGRRGEAAPVQRSEGQRLAGRSPVAI